MHTVYLVCVPEGAASLADLRGVRNLLLFHDERDDHTNVRADGARQRAHVRSQNVVKSGSPKSG